MLSADTDHTHHSEETVFDIATDVIRLLLEANETLGVGESLTAGGVMAALTSVPGASAAFRGGVVAYTAELKKKLLNVDAALIEKEGVIHPQVARQMAQGARRATTPDEKTTTMTAEAALTTWGVGTTGAAGPKGQDGKPPGTVYIGVAGPEGERAWGPFDFAGDRERIREETVAEALSRLRWVLTVRSGWST